MSKPAEHPSGPKQSVCIRLSPDHLARLDQLAAERHANRSVIVARLIDRAQPPKETP
jgi:predicted transcriptional regulator